MKSARERIEFAIARSRKANGECVTIDAHSEDEWNWLLDECDEWQYREYDNQHTVISSRRAPEWSIQIMHKWTLNEHGGKDETQMGPG